MTQAHLPRLNHHPATAIALEVFVAIFLMTLLTMAPLAVQAETIYKYINSKGEVVFTDHPTKGAQKITITPPPPIPLTPINLPPPTPPATQPPRPATNTTAPSTPLVPSVQMRPPGTLPNQSPSSAQGSSLGSPSGTTPVISSPAQAAPTGSPANAPRIIRQPLPESRAASIPPQHRNGHYQSLIITQPKAGPVKAHAGGTIFVQTKLSPELDLSAGDRMRIVIDGNIRVDDSTGQRFMISDLSPGTHAIIAIVMRKGKNIFQSNPVVIDLTQGADNNAQK